MIKRVGIWILWVVWGSWVSWALLNILEIYSVKFLFLFERNTPELEYIAHRAPNVLPFESALLFIIGCLFYWAARPVPRWVQGNVLAVVGATIAGVLMGGINTSISATASHVALFAIIALIGILVSSMIHGRLVSTLIWTGGAPVFGVMAAALYGLAMIALFAPLGVSDAEVLGGGEALSGDVAMAGDTALVVTVHSDGAAHVYSGDKVVAMVRGHGARVVHAAFTKARDSVLTIDASGGTRVTKIAWRADMHQMADMSTPMKMGHERLWKRYVGAASEWALSVVAQVLPLHIPMHAQGGRGAMFKDCDICPEMVIIKPGRFLMGSPWFEEGRGGEGGPRRLVTIDKPFAVGRFEVTFAQWDAAQDDPEWETITGLKPRRREDQGWGRGNRPVINVSWEDAKAYAKWLTKKSQVEKEGSSYRLLSAAEWEYVARAGTTTRFSWGNEASHQFANYGADDCCNGLAAGRDRWVNTAPAGQFPANSFGLHDMHGNASEWTVDCVFRDLGCVPVDDSDKRGGVLAFRFSRGGSWRDFPSFLRTAGRLAATGDLGLSGIGFRVARTLAP